MTATNSGSPYPDPTNWSEHHVSIGRARTYW